METRKCPECGVENEISRATCQVCHVPMIPKKVKGSPNPLEDKVLDVKEAKEKPARQKKESAPKDKKEEKKSPVPKVKRRTRRKSKIPEPTTFLVLQDGKLQAVNVRLTVKTIKPKDVSGVERNLISMWNRTIDFRKQLFTK